MTYDSLLETVAHWSAILTAVVATLAYCRYVLERRQKRLRLECYLKAEKSAGADKGQRTLLHLVANLGMTEADILDAAFGSRQFRRVVAKDTQGRAGTHSLECQP